LIDAASNSCPFNANEPAATISSCLRFMKYPRFLG
jgi:hypothetical protein